MSGTPGETNHERRAEVLRHELERRLEILEQSDDEAFGAFTTLDWVLCTILFFALPLVVLVLMIL